MSERTEVSFDAALMMALRADAQKELDELPSPAQLKERYHVQQFRNKVGQADETLDLSAAFSAFLSDNIGGFKIPDKLSGIFF